MPKTLPAEWFWVERWFSSSAMLLNLEQRGLYREMLTRAWALGGKLPCDEEEIMRIVSVTASEWERCWPAVKPYWKRDGSWIFNKTQREVLSASFKHHEAQRDKGLKRVATAERGEDGRFRPNEPAEPAEAPAERSSPRSSREPASHPSSLHHDNSHSQDNDSARRKRRATVYPDHFNLFWTAYPKKASKRAALKAWNDRVDPEIRGEVVAAIAHHKDKNPKWLGGYVHDPATWLNGECWNDEFGGDNGNPATSKAKQRQNTNIAALKAAREADDAHERRVRQGHGDDGRDAEWRSDAGEGPDLLECPEG